jgi:glycosyltransferase involved in cell wall biosynthesis
VKAINLGASQGGRETLHYLGYSDDRGGIVSVIRALAAAGRFQCILGVNPGFRQGRTPALPTLELPDLDGERLGFRTFWRARGAAAVVRRWLAGDSSRMFHGHSRAGLVVALWLARSDSRQVVASVHCYGKQRWFYRWGARRLGGRVFFASPAMKRYYGVGDGASWENCIPGCIASSPDLSSRARPLSHGVVRLGGIGAIARWKRWDLVLDALNVVPGALRASLRFAHIGSPDGSADSIMHAAELREKTRFLGLEGIVDWRGEQASSFNFLRETDCLVVASQNEPFSIATLEALSEGVPVLAAESGGPCDILTAPRNGWFFRPGDSGDLARRLGNLVEGDALQGVRIEPRDLERFTAAHVAGQWADAYSRLSGIER